MCDRLLNHVTGAIQVVAAVYQRAEFLVELRAALEALLQATSPSDLVNPILCRVFSQGMVGGLGVVTSGAWPNNPLVYVLALARFPMVASMGDFVTAFGNIIGQRYPYRNHHTNQVATAEFGPEGLRLNTQQQTLWQFRRDDRARAVLVGPDFILLHCGKGGYTNHFAFADELANLIRDLASVPGIALTHITSVGYRYVDLILPVEGTTLHDYLQGWAIPSDIPVQSIADLEVAEGTSVSVDVPRFR